MRGNWGLRAAGMLAVGSLATHELSYLLAGGRGLGGHGHSYLPLAAALGTVLLMLACASFARALVRALRGAHEDSPPPFAWLWAAMAAALLAVFGLQEWIESWAAPEHPAGITHVAGHVGPLGLVVVVALGGMIALLLRGAHAAAVAIAHRRAPARRPRPARAFRIALLRAHFPRVGVLAGNVAGRAPPQRS